MDKLLKQRFKPQNADFITLFLPGFPGEYKDRPLMEDLKLFNSAIFSITYPGTYGEQGTFSIQNSIDAVKNAIKNLKSLNLPILIVCYSFSSLLIANCVTDSDPLIGILIFSPVVDLNKSIKDDFITLLKDIQTKNQNLFNVDLESFVAYIETSDQDSYLKSFNELNSLSVPVCFFLGNNDPGVNISYVYQQIQSIQINRKIIFRIINGEHQLDTLYKPNYAKRLLLSLIFSLKLKTLSTNIKGVYLWGSTLNYELSHKDSDLDMIIIGEQMSYAFLSQINSLKTKFEEASGVKIDLIFNTLKEINSGKVIRRNRGLLFTYELNSQYLNLFGNIQINHIKTQELLNDILLMVYSSIYHARKTILNNTINSESRLCNIKNFIYNCYNFLYTVGYQSFNLQDCLNFFEKNNTDIYMALQKCLKLKVNNYQNIDTDFDLYLMKLTEKLFEKYINNNQNSWFIEADI